MITHEEQWLEKGETLICFGDSITAAENGYVKILQERLAKSGIKVVNAGRGGDKTPKALTRFQQAVLDAKPSAVSIYLGTNDSAIGHGKWADEPQVQPITYRDNLMWMAYLCKQNGINKISYATPAWRFEGDAFADFGDAMTAYCLAARDAADRSFSRLVPLDHAFANAWAKKPGHTGLLMTTDGVHMNPEGNQLIADTMLKTWNMD